MAGRIKIVSVEHARGFPGGYVSKTSEGVTALSLNFSSYLSREFMPSVSFSQRLTDFRTSRAVIERDLAETAIAGSQELAKQMQIDGGCLFVDVHGNNQHLVPQHLTKRPAIEPFASFFDGESFAEAIKSSVDLKGFDSKFLYSCHGSSHMETIAQETGLRVITSDNIAFQEFGYDSLEVERVSVITEAFQELLTEAVSLSPKKCTIDEISELLKTLSVPKKLKQNPEILLDCLSGRKTYLEVFLPDLFPGFYGNLMECSPGEKPKIVPSKEFPMITRQEPNHNSGDLNDTSKSDPFLDRPPEPRNTYSKKSTLNVPVLPSLRSAILFGSHK